MYVRKENVGKGGRIMPIIAISVSKKVYDFYHGMKSGTRSKHFNNILERHVRLWTYQPEISKMSFDELATRNQSLLDVIETLTNDLHELQKSDRNDLNPTFMEYILNLPSNILRALLRR